MSQKTYILIAIFAALSLILFALSDSESSGLAPLPPPLVLPEATFIPRIPAVTPTPSYLLNRPLYFNNYPCTEDCSGHEAGYEWAEENGIENTDDCGGNSNSFIEGCQSYVEENYTSDGEDSEYEDYY